MGNQKKISDENNEDSINLLDFFIILAKHKKIIILFPLIAAIITSIYCLTLPKTYSASVSMLPPSSNKVQVPSNLQSLGGLLGLGLSQSFNKNLYVELMKSATITDRIANRFNLLDNDKENKLKNEIKAIDSLKANVIFSTDSLQKMLNSSQLITITVYNNNYELAAQIANAYVEELQTLLNEIAVTEASQRRLFLEKQLEQASDALINTEEDMKAFQEKTGILELGGEINIAMDKFAPVLILEYKRIFRQLKFNETMYEIIVKQYEAAKIDEAKNSALIQVVDKATPSEIRRRSNRRKTVMNATFAWFILAILIVFFIEYYRKLSSITNENREKITTLVKYLSFKKTN